MKKLLLFLFVFLWMITFSFAQGASTVSSGSTAQKQTKKVGLAIDPLNKADIKALDDALKPYEETVKEYNRIVGLRDRIYQTLIRAKGIDFKDMVGQPVITTDSINLVLKVESAKK